MNEVGSASVNATIFGLAWLASLSGTSVELINAMITLLLLDWITGIGKSIAIGRPVTSKIGSVGVISKLSLLIIPLTISSVGTGTDLDLTQLVNYSIAVLCVNEGYSIIGNTIAIKTRKDVAEWSVVELLLKKIQQVFLALIVEKEDRDTKKD